MNESSLPEMGSITVKRESKFIGSALGMEIYLNNQYIALIKNGKSIDLPTHSGDHAIYAVLSGAGTRSNPLFFHLANNERIRIVCGVSGLTGVYMKRL